MKIPLPGLIKFPTSAKKSSVTDKIFVPHLSSAKLIHLSENVESYPSGRMIVSIIFP